MIKPTAFKIVKRLDGNLRVSMGSNHRTVTEEDLMVLRDVINRYFFFQGEGVCGDDYVPPTSKLYDLQD